MLILHASKLVDALSRGDTEGSAALFSYDGALEDLCLNMKMVGLHTVSRYLARASHKSPYGPGLQLGNVVGGDIGGGFEWVSSSSEVRTGVTSLSLNAEGRITRMIVVYDGRDLSAPSRNELALLTLEPLQ